MRITSKAQACGTTSSSKVDKIDHCIIMMRPKDGQRRTKQGLHCLRKPCSFHKLSHPHVYTSLPISLHLYEISNIDIPASDCFVWILKAFPCFGVIVTARQSLWWVAFCFRVINHARSSKRLLLVWSTV